MTSCASSPKLNMIWTNLKRPITPLLHGGITYTDEQTVPEIRTKKNFPAHSPTKTLFLLTISPTSTDDTIGLYLKEVSRVPQSLLNNITEEVELAKRIEKGRGCALNLPKAI